MMWAELRVFLVMLQGLVFAKQPTSWSLAKACVEGMVGALVLSDIDPSCFLDRANLALRYLRRCWLEQDLQVSTNIYSGPRGEEVTYLISVMTHRDDTAAQLLREQEDRLYEIGFLREDLRANGDDSASWVRLTHLEQVYSRVRQESSDIALLHLLGLSPVADAFQGVM